MKYKNMLLILMIFCLSGCSFVNLLRMRNANDGIYPTWKNNVVNVDLVTHYIGVKPYVEISINGTTGFKFLVDTGATFSVLFDSIKAQQLSLETGYELQMHGWGDDGHSKGFQVKAKQVNLNGVSFEDVSFAYLPISKSKYMISSEELIYDGVIGHDLMHHFSWTFDKQNNRINISNQAYLPTGEESKIPFDIFLSKLGIESEIDFGNDQVFKQDLVIDTGSRHYLKVNAGFISKENIQLPQPQITASDFGLSGQAIHQRVTLPNLKLGLLDAPPTNTNSLANSKNLNSINFSQIKTNVIGTPDDDEDQFWVIGSALLNQYVSVIDYHTNTMYLSPYSNSQFASKFNLLGLELRKVRSGNFIVRYVFPQLAAAKFDFKTGDLISRIDEYEAKDVSLEKWLKISDRAGQHQICRIRNTEVCFTINSKEIIGYSFPKN